MNFENPSAKDQPKSLLDSLKDDIVAAEAELKSHYKNKESGPMDAYAEGKEKSTDLLAMRKAAKTLEAAGGDVEAAITKLKDMLEEGAAGNDAVYERAVILLERKGRSN